MPGVIPESVLVPAYFHPAVTDWTDLADPRVGTVILNVDSGAGTVRDRALAAAADRLAAAGVRVTGYADTAYGRRPPAEVAGELERYRAWYGLRAVFLDQMSAVPEHVPRYRALVAGLRERGAEHLTCNPGVYPDPGYAPLADLLVTFEGPWAAHRRVRAPAWAARLPAERFCHLVHAVPGPALRRTLARAGRCNAGAVYVTDRTGANPWDGLPRYFRRELALVAGARP